jgi:sialate O-acetylesterase
MGKLELASVFSNNMVLQRNRPIPLWGRARGGLTVKVRLGDASASTQANADGRWSVTLPALPAGGPFELNAQAGEQIITLCNVLIGEVWVCSGQSNMEWPLSLCTNAEEELARASHPQIRLLQVPKRLSGHPQDSIVGEWTVCSPETASAFTGVGYFFGRKLHQRLGVPIGLINSSWGGTIVEAWTSTEALSTQKELLEVFRQNHEALTDLPKAQADYVRKLKEWEHAAYWEDPGNKGEGLGYARPDFNDADWGTMATPGCWEGHGLNIDGSVWFRREVSIDASWAGRELLLNIGAVDDYDTTYFNGVKIGGIGAERPNPWSVPRQYKVDGSLVKAGRNVIAIRVFDRFGGGGLLGPAIEMNLRQEGEYESRIRLDGVWKYKIELALEPKIAPPMPLAPPYGDNPNTLAALFNGMINPLIPYAIGGAIWYQGESNASCAYKYRRYFPLMIDDWRKRWGCDLPFLFVELANFEALQTKPVEPQTWPELREAQQMTLAWPKTGMASAIDIGEAGDIHPKNKQEVGRRLALSALHVAYGQSLVHSGPLYQSSAIEGSGIRIHWQHVGGGLVARDAQLKGFAITGEDRNWVWAQAKIDGPSVLVWSDEVPRPVAARYSWANNPVGNLYNKEGLPASSFRTDDWPGITANN